MALGARGMSACISTQGEFNSHATDGQYLCGRCNAFDADGALAELRELRGERDRLRQQLTQFSLTGMSLAERATAAMAAAISEPLDSATRTYRGDSDSFALVSDANRARAERWHPDFPDDGWTGADWANAAAGEMGEACNVVKKLRRAEFGAAGKPDGPPAELRAALAQEIGDTFLYLDLLAQFYGLNIAHCIADTFNRVSIREGLPERVSWERG